MNSEQKEAIPENQEKQTLMLENKHTECDLKQFDQVQSNETGLWCGKIWDGVLCWPPTRSGTLQVLGCPEYVAGFTATGNATKYCTDNGSWYIKPETNLTWTNLTQCGSGKGFQKFDPFPKLPPDSLALIHVGRVKTIARIGYCVSLITLIVAFAILASCRRLRCPRNLLHMHLFVSFILRASLSLLKDSVFVDGIGLPADLAMIEGGMVFVGGNWGCKFITTIWQFFIMTNYSWILMEGLYLHNLIFLALFSDTSTVSGYILLGWSLPVLTIVPWVIVRINLDDELCWTHYADRSYALIIEIPTIIFMIINFFLFLNVVRVLHLKLAATISEDTRRYRRWAKSTLVLAPLFGVHTTLLNWMMYIGSKSIVVEIIWLYCDQIFCSFQGLFVAVLYCFLNGEVRAELEKKWDKARSTARWQYSLTEGPSQDGALGGGYLRRQSSEPSTFAGRFFGAARRKRNNNDVSPGTIETCVTTFNSSYNNVNQQQNQPASNESADTEKNGGLKRPNQYVDSQTESSPKNKLVCSV